MRTITVQIVCSYVTIGERGCHRGEIVEKLNPATAAVLIQNRQAVEIDPADLPAKAEVPIETPSVSGEAEADTGQPEVGETKPESDTKEDEIKQPEQPVVPGRAGRNRN